MSQQKDEAFIPPRPPKPSATPPVSSSSIGPSTLSPSLKLPLPPRGINHGKASEHSVSCPAVILGDRNHKGSHPSAIGTNPSAKTIPVYGNQAQALDHSALKLASASELELEVIGNPMSLREFSKRKRQRDLPCLVKVADGHHSICEHYSFGQEQMFVVMEKKSMLVATCKDPTDGSTYSIPVNTKSFELAPHWMDTEPVRPRSLGKITAQELLRCKSVPPVIAVSEEFELSDRSKTKVPVGTLLFTKEKTKQRTEQQHGLVLHAKSESGEMVNITLDCKGRFSVLARDVRVSLQKAVNHLKPPFTMRTISDCDTMFVDVVIVENAQEEGVLVGMMKVTEGTTIEDVASFSRIAEVPVNLNLTVVIMAPKEREILDHIYDYVHIGYYRVGRQPTREARNPVKIAMSLNPSYLDFPADQAFQMKPYANVMPSGQPAERQSYEFSSMAQKVSSNLQVSAAEHRIENIYEPVSPNAYATLNADSPFNSDDETPTSDSVLPIPKREYASTNEGPTSETEAATPKDEAPTFEGDIPVSACKDRPAIAEPQEAQKDTAKNIEYLQTMQKTDILKLLDAMNLNAYKDAFDEEQIDGETMACLSHEMLIELGVSKSLHRLRLMKIITGQTSAETILKSTP